MILCDAEIRWALTHGELIIDPLPAPESISTSAVDLTLGDYFARWKLPEQPGVTLTIDPSEADYSAIAETFQERIPLDSAGGVTIHPREFLLALTRERVELPLKSRLAARVEGRSSLARMGLGIHLSAPTIHADFRGQITLEITNHGPIPIRLRPGLPICQLIIEQVFGTPTKAMTGTFQDQSSVTGKAAEEGA